MKLGPQAGFLLAAVSGGSCRGQSPLGNRLEALHGESSVGQNRLFAKPEQLPLAESASESPVVSLSGGPQPRKHAKLQNIRRNHERTHGNPGEKFLCGARRYWIPATAGA